MTVRPARAAGLVLLRRAAAETGDPFEVLLGRRHRRSRFMPNIYVFPGGRIDAADNRPSGFAEDLPVTPGALPLSDAELAACARAAVRETFEETGLLFGLPGRQTPGVERPVGDIWTAFASTGLAPAFVAMRLVARAVTPARYPIRFDTYFFAADGAVAQGHLAGDGELEDVGWVPVGSAVALPMAEVTRLILREAISHQGQAAGIGEVPTFSV